MYKSLVLPICIALFFHAALIAVLIIDAPETEPTIRRAATQYIKAELVKLDKPKPPPKAKPKPPVNKKTKPKKNVPSKAEQLAAAKAKALREQQSAAKKQAEQKLAEEKRQQQAQQESERKLRIQQQAERELADAIEQESGIQQVESDAALANSYIALITDLIQNSWNRPPSARNNMEAELSLQLVPTGEVVGVRISKSSGNREFDLAAERAVLKVGRIKELQNLPPRVFEEYFRHLRLKFRPEDLRL